MVVITKMIAKTYRASINAADLKDRGVRRYRKFVHHVCGVPESVLDIDWVFLEDFSTVRNALIHANGNLGLTSNRREMEVVLARYPKLLGLRHSAKIEVSAEFVVQCMVATRAAALALLSADRLKAESDSENT